MSIIENIQSFSDLGKYTGTVFIDLWKAFDTLDHNILHTKKKKKKEHYGVRGIWAYQLIACDDTNVCPHMPIFI